MPQSLKTSVFRVLDGENNIFGTGFLVSNNLAVTCAHVIQDAGSNPGDEIRIEFFSDGSHQMAKVLTAGWANPTGDDVAFLELDTMPKGAQPVVLGSAQYRQGHDYLALGFPDFPPYQARWPQAKIGGVVPVGEERQSLLQLKGDEIKKGLSGAPVLDQNTDRVVGMVTEYKDDEYVRFAYATTADTLKELKPKLELWPDTYGPKELFTYLDFLISSNDTLRLPDGHEVELERIYVSLRADEMNAVERQAEHDLYLEDVESIQALASANNADKYTIFGAMRKAVARRPRMQMLEARNWERLFGERDRRNRSLAEVIQEHQYTVILGDPGSGKTTLCHWLALQMARSLKQGEDQLQVRADQINPEATEQEEVNLGIPRLPVLIRIADYAKARFDGHGEDRELTLTQFIASGNIHGVKVLPAGLSRQAVGALLLDYLEADRALIILDGLDEVGDPGQRQKVMLDTDRFIREQRGGLSLSIKASSGNPVLLTSRIVGYQFQPLTHLPHYTVEDMGEKAIAAFCQAWMTHVAQPEDTSPEAEAQKLKDAIYEHAHPGVRILAGNPLLLTILAQVYWQSAERALPTRRVSLFEQAARAIYDQRERYWDQIGITPLRLNLALGAVAAYLQKYEVSGFIEEGTVRAQLATVLDNPDQVESVLEVARDVSGFLVARGQGVYGFLHRALQEYFAALHLTAIPDQAAEKLAAYVLNPTWREPLILGIGIVSQRGYPDSRKLLPKVFKRILDVPDPAGNYLPRREFLAAAACAECVRTY